MYIDANKLPLKISEKFKDKISRMGLRRRPKFFADTSNFTSIDYGDVIYADSRFFLVTGYTKEGRFGVDDQPKQWVPKTIDLATGKWQILKLVFH